MLLLEVSCMRGVQKPHTVPGVLRSLGSQCLPRNQNDQRSKPTSSGKMPLINAAHRMEEEPVIKRPIVTQVIFNARTRGVGFVVPNACSHSTNKLIT